MIRNSSVAPRSMRSVAVQGLQRARHLTADTFERVASSGLRGLRKPFSTEALAPLPSLERCFEQCQALFDAPPNHGMWQRSKSYHTLRALLDQIKRDYLPPFFDDAPLTLEQTKFCLLLAHWYIAMAERPNRTHKIHDDILRAERYLFIADNSPYASLAEDTKQLKNKLLLDVGDVPKMGALIQLGHARLKTTDIPLDLYEGNRAAWLSLWQGLPNKDAPHNCILWNQEVLNALLTLAASQGLSGVVQKLCEAGADVLNIDENNLNAVEWACLCERQATVRLLIEHRLQPEINHSVVTAFLENNLSDPTAQDIERYLNQSNFIALQYMWQRMPDTAKDQLRNNCHHLFGIMRQRSDDPRRLQWLQMQRFVEAAPRVESSETSSSQEQRVVAMRRREPTLNQLIGLWSLLGITIVAAVIQSLFNIFRPQTGEPRND